MTFPKQDEGKRTNDANISSGHKSGFKKWYKKRHRENFITGVGERTSKNKSPGRAGGNALKTIPKKG